MNDCGDCGPVQWAGPGRESSSSAVTAAPTMLTLVLAPGLTPDKAIAHPPDTSQHDSLPGAGDAKHPAFQAAGSECIPSRVQEIGTQQQQTREARANSSRLGSRPWHYCHTRPGNSSSSAGTAGPSHEMPVTLLPPPSCDPQRVSRRAQKFLVGKTACC